MSRFAEGPRRQDPYNGNEVLRPEGQCGREGCANPASIALIVVIDSTGQRRMGAASEYCEGWSLRHGFQHGGWYERCAFCYSIERMNEEAARLKQEGLKHPMPSWNKPPYSLIGSRDAFMQHFNANSVGEALAKTLGGHKRD